MNQEVKFIRLDEKTTINQEDFREIAISAAKSSGLSTYYDFKKDLIKFKAGKISFFNGKTTICGRYLDKWDFTYSKMKLNELIGFLSRSQEDVMNVAKKLKVFDELLVRRLNTDRGMYKSYDYRQFENEYLLYQVIKTRYPQTIYSVSAGTVFVSELNNIPISLKIDYADGFEVYKTHRDISVNANPEQFKSSSFSSDLATQLEGVYVQTLYSSERLTPFIDFYPWINDSGYYTHDNRYTETMNSVEKWIQEETDLVDKLEAEFDEIIMKSTRIFNERSASYFKFNNYFFVITVANRKVYISKEERQIRSRAHKIYNSL